ncbi:flagellar hook-basal body protein [Engelhardtia mirabilis]|uniref:Flagellar basal-body rod protein FlgG n=1 Tax=Engelhardtia mirabilis TaxID=2528011 RepID=A0A518BSZ9_9BACT|nr:Flagellar basal-body rod protein FlgG [Planctomycetes bacterium Pla133]QDV04410.1 Flagellar basal-body rod protein FlgG [Planctomycetes bacterium Pla86]
MDSGLYSAVGSMRSSLRSLDVLAHNLSNLGTHGYKRRSPSAKLFDAHTDFGQTRAIGTRGWVDHGQGGLDQTGDDFHLALMGEGFFAAESPEGEVYTRVGRLSFDADGNLTTAEGYPMAWENQEVALNPSGEAPVIDDNGQVYQGLVSIGRLKLVAFADKRDLNETSAGYWLARPKAQQVPPDAQVRQGFLERSNSEGVVELIDLVENQRAYEIASKAVTQIDQSYRRLNQGRS